ncbi:type IV pilin N-terminal domain-containing protein [Natronomonas gomsonensis]|jgi:FlaG/FlaF family flagellin (archaellin)|uniref:type IV pilin n=1 Tax=Natronomonas gomsonensis TaxID=1046043 RepID=UPI0020CA5514|nr:type IV pilin N-terminal domain-containing protein [Natronomonas gomsonensis]MCY4732070.1 type IV pilin N-terminal domain-containing protein [Natronomonas gomsonensis]
MKRTFQGGLRGASTVTGTILMVAVVVILSSVVGAFVFGLGPSPSPPAPQASISHAILDDAGPDDDDIIAVTLESGTAIETENLYVIGSKKLDIGGAPDSSKPANDDHASEREKFTEAASGDPQVGIGETWDSGETVYLDPEGHSADGVTVKIYWTTRPVEGYNPGTVEGEDSYKIAEFTV